jgi:hypothetical protein
VVLTSELLTTEREALLAFPDSDPQQPVILGLLQNPTPPAPAMIGQHAPRPALEVAADGRRVTITAYSVLELCCGESKITLRRDGKISIQGVSILSRARVCHRIKGGSVQIN